MACRPVRDVWHRGTDHRLAIRIPKACRPVRDAARHLTIDCSANRALPRRSIRAGQRPATTDYFAYWNGWVCHAEDS